MIAKVKAWIADHFDLGAVEIKPFELLPAGHRVIDKHGKEILVYYDILTGQIIYKEEREGVKNMHGYSNTETWECYNWLTADDDTYKRAVELAKGETPAKALEAYCWELMGDITPFADSLLELVFNEVNWQEIITTLTE